MAMRGIAMLCRSGMARISAAVVAVRTMDALQTRGLYIMSVQGLRSDDALQHERDHDEDSQPTVERMAHSRHCWAPP